MFLRIYMRFPELFKCLRNFIPFHAFIRGQIQTHRGLEDRHQNFLYKTKFGTRLGLSHPLVDHIDPWAGLAPTTSTVVYGRRGQPGPLTLLCNKSSSIFCPPSYEYLSVSGLYSSCDHRIRGVLK